MVSDRFQTLHAVLNPMGLKRCTLSVEPRWWSDPSPDLPPLETRRWGPVYVWNRRLYSFVPDCFRTEYPWYFVKLASDYRKAAPMYVNLDLNGRVEPIYVRQCGIEALAQIDPAVFQICVPFAKCNNLERYIRSSYDQMIKEN